MDWSFPNRKSVSVREETVIRIVKLLSFGKFLVNLEGVGIEYDAVNNIFTCKIEDSKDGDDKVSLTLLEEMVRCNFEGSYLFISGYVILLFVNSILFYSCYLSTFLISLLPFSLQEQQDISNSKPNSHGDTNEVKPGGGNGGGQLNKMKHMGQLWLAAEVRALESRVGGKSALSPYLVLDADALIKYTFMVKNLVNSRKFIVLVPTAGKFVFMLILEIKPCIIDCCFESLLLCCSCICLR